MSQLGKLVVDLHKCVEDLRSQLAAAVKERDEANAAVNVMATVYAAEMGNRPEVGLRHVVAFSIANNPIASAALDKARNPK